MRPQNGETVYRLIHSQEMVQYMWRYTLHIQATQIPMSIAFDEELDFALLARAVNVEIERNDCLRLRIFRDGLRIKQFFLKEYRLEKIRLKEFRTKEEQEAYFDKDASTELKVFQGETFRIAFFRAWDGKCGIFLNASHMIMDFGATFIFIKDLMEVYDSLKNGSPMPKPMGRYEDEIIKEQDNPALEEHLKQEGQILDDWVAKEGPTFFPMMNGTKTLEKHRRLFRMKNLRIPFVYMPLNDKTHLIKEYLSEEASREIDAFLANNPVSAEWRDTLSFLYNDGYWHDKTATVLGSLNVRISSPGIPPQLAARLYGQNRLSVSAIETAGTCMYWAFLSYALHVRERKDFVFETDSEGTFSHEVLKEFFDRAAALPSFPALSDGEIASLLDSVMTAQIKPWENGPLGRNMSGRFRGEEITAYVGTAVTTLAKAIKNVPHFRPIGMEVGFGRMHTDSKLHFPPVTLTLDGGETITISGVIDRVDTAEFDDGRKAVLVYDFKSSDKDVRADAIKAGVQLQLPIYLIAVKQGMPDYILAGALYQPVKEVIDKADDGDIAKINENIDNALRARGVFLSDEIIKKASYPLKVPKNMSNTNLISAVTAEGLEDVMKKGADSAKNVIERMLSGDTTPNPLQDGMRSPCEYCGMKEACPFDSRLEGGRVRKLSESADEED